MCGLGPEQTVQGLTSRPGRGFPERQHTAACCERAPHAPPMRVITSAIQRLYRHGYPVVPFSHDAWSASKLRVPFVSQGLALQTVVPLTAAAASVGRLGQMLGRKAFCPLIMAWSCQQCTLGAVALHSFGHGRLASRGCVCTRPPPGGGGAAPRLCPASSSAWPPAGNLHMAAPKQPVGRGWRIPSPDVASSRGAKPAAARPSGGGGKPCGGVPAPAAGAGAGLEASEAPEVARSSPGAAQWAHAASLPALFPQ